MNFGRGFSIPQENGLLQNMDPWIQVTLEKPFPPRSNLIPVDMQGNQLGRENWQELLGIYSGFLQETTNYDRGIQNSNPTCPMGLNEGHCDWDAIADEKNQSFNGNVGSYAQTFGNDSEAWNSNPLSEFIGIKNAASMASANGSQNKSIHFRSRPTVPNSYTQDERNWTESEFANSMPAQQNRTFGSNERINCYSLPQLPTDGFPVPYRRNYNLNSPPRSEADAAWRVTNSFQFVPVTPDQAKQSESHRFSEVLVDDRSSQEKDNQGNLSMSVRKEDTENQCDELIQNNMDSSFPAISTTLKENNVSDEGDELIDMNKTPEQKLPKRRKHRPKVVIEGKPKRTPKPDAPKNSPSKENPSGKRNYVHKKGLKTSETQPSNVMNEVAVPSVGPAAKSCRRALNFDLENGRRDESQDRTGSWQAITHQERIGFFNLNLASQDTELCAMRGQSNGCGTEKIGLIVQQNGYGTENNQAGANCNLNRSTNQMPAKVKDHTLNVIARNVNMRNFNPCQNSGRNGYCHLHQHIRGEGIDQIAFQADTTSTNFDRTRQQMLHGSSQSITKDEAQFNEKRGFKREYCHTIEQIHPRKVNPMGSPIQKMVQAVDNNRDSNSFGRVCSEIHKKNKTENGFHETTPGMTSSITAVGDYLRQVETGAINGVYGNNATSQIINGVYANNATSQLNGRILNSYFERENKSKKLINAVNGTAGNWWIHPTAAEHNFQKQEVSSVVQPHTAWMEENRTRGSIQFHDLDSLPTTTNWNHLSTATLEQARTCDYLQGFETCHANTLEMKQTVEPTRCNQGSCGTDKVLQQQRKDALEGYQQSFTKARGPVGKHKFPFSVDDITYQLQGLHINGRNNDINGQEKYALVPYKGGSTIVPYVGFDPIKKRKPRPKVDLDPETDRIWKLLMGKEGSEGTEATDKDKEKWWEEERTVFRGRADSFIARMHLVQGDRRFSRWKGSVVDSVIGVFLTQNVSDHLSSSAFMSLAAKFPLRSTTTNQACNQNGITVVVEEPDIQVLDPYGGIKCCEKIRQPVFNRSSITSCESPEHRINHLSLGTRISAENNHRWMADEIISSPKSFDSFIFQKSEEIRSSSGSNSGAEDRTTGCKPNKNSTPINLLQTNKATMFKEFYSHVNGSSILNERYTNRHQQSENPKCNRQNPKLGRVNNGFSTFTVPINSNILNMRESIVSSSNFQSDSGVLEARWFEVLGEENLSSLPSIASRITKAKAVNNMSKRKGHMEESTNKTTAQHNGVSRIQAPTRGPYECLSKHPTQQGNLQPRPHPGSNQHPINNHQQEMSRTFQLERGFLTEPMGPAEALAKRQAGASQQVSDDLKLTGKTFNTEERFFVVDKQNFFENKSTEANTKEQIYSSDKPFSETGTNISNARKGKADGEKSKAFDWDSLRKWAQSNGKRERSKDTMDSLDYEAVRLADVNEISNAIKERGMNNLLAERIKDFLNRLFTEHGSIDLEWLRDVPPDKAKDYLLSVWGLGLKSVECVRLLTLHHLAFPVDTNVGRIAVRLGWVPLQPLPESLQLHLLELYPVLESIQKYLWPRLCKLDQRTLYELHYQMITFGKVFCTKSKPNCNACPMRAECRHFASAFASARLALPGPEERSIVSSAVPIATDKNAAVVFKPMPLLPTENNSNKETGFIDRKCEPIIEEPTTPEPETIEVSESDIEDAFYDDPDEIPMIKLNIEEFTLNLNNYMQDMELKEGDTSKALVALNTKAASIPTPKLKNVSRLRTEHQVYELPDSHPLLKGLDKREPDDPSPYLLAIWTPGETANSVQPPESRCWAQESGKLCNDYACFSCNSIRETNSQTVRGTLLIPCRTAMRGSFPLNGTYFQVNEMFADHESSLNPIDVPRAWIWNLPKRTVYFGTSVSTIFKGLSTDGIQYCFWRGFVCVRGFDQKIRAPRPLMARLHFPASKLVRTKNEEKLVSHEAKPITS